MTKIEYSISKKEVDGFIVNEVNSYGNTGMKVKEFKKYIKSQFKKVIFIRMYKKDICND